MAYLFLRLSAWSASLALPDNPSTLPSADCLWVIGRLAALSVLADTQWLSRGTPDNFPRITVGSTWRAQRPVHGLPIVLHPRPEYAPPQPLPVRRPAILPPISSPHASLRYSYLWLTFELVSLVRDFAPVRVSPSRASPFSCRTRPAHNVSGEDRRVCEPYPPPLGSIPSSSSSSLCRR